MFGVTLTIGVVSVILLAGSIYQALGSRRDRRTLPIGTFITLGDGRRLHVHCAGTGDPAVILEAGIAASSVSWAHVHPRVAEFTRVCSYDRAGLGWSAADSRPTSVISHAETLRDLLHTLRISPPYVLVGHSYGSFVVRAYADRFRQDVGGVILLDPIYSSQWATPTAEVQRRLRGGVFLSRVGGVLASIGFVRLCLAALTGGAPGAARRVSHAFGTEAVGTLSRLVGEVRKLPPETWPSIRALWSQPKCFTAMARHLAALSESARVLSSCTSLGDVPLVVITSGHQPDDSRLEQQRLAAGSSRGRQVVAAGSGHWVHLDDPELVIATIREMVEAVRGGGRYDASNGV